LGRHQRLQQLVDLLQSLLLDRVGLACADRGRALVDEPADLPHRLLLLWVLEPWQQRRGDLGPGQHRRPGALLLPGTVPRLD
jgi:hypothetical protein